MIDKGLLVSAVSPKNRREHLTTPTKKGVRMTEEAVIVLNSTHSGMFNAIGEKQQQQLLSTLSDMHHHACQAGKIGACHHPYNT